MFYDEHQYEERNKRDYKLYKENPEAYRQLVRHRAAGTWLAILAIYIPGGAYVVVQHFPSAPEINAYLASPHFQTWFPFYAGIAGLLLLGVKYAVPILFGASELIFAIASAFAADKPIATHGLGAWAAAVAAVYLFAKGFEEIGKGWKRIADRSASRTVSPTQVASASPEADSETKENTSE